MSEPVWLNRKCVDCEFWVRQPADPNNLGKKIGQCRESKQLQVLTAVTPQGIQNQVGITFPLIDAEDNACGRFKARLKLQIVGNGGNPSAADEALWAAGESRPAAKC